MNMRQIILCRNGIAGHFFSLFYLFFACNVRRFFVVVICEHSFLCVRLNKMYAFDCACCVCFGYRDMCLISFGPITSFYQCEQLLKNCNQYIVLCVYYEQPNKQKYMFAVIYEFDFILRIFRLEVQIPVDFILMQAYMYFLLLFVVVLVRFRIAPSSSLGLAHSI